MEHTLARRLALRTGSQKPNMLWPASVAVMEQADSVISLHGAPRIKLTAGQRLLSAI